MKNVIKKLNQLSKMGKNNNGIYLLEHDKHMQYILLNDYITKQGAKAYYFTSVIAKAVGKTLIINLKEKSTNNYKNRKISNLLLYKINKPNNTNKIDIYKNDKRTYFESIVCN